MVAFDMGVCRHRIPPQPKPFVSEQPVTLSILMPVRNEGANLDLMVKILNAVVEVPHEILVVYDSPDDDTLDIAARLRPSFASLRLVHNQLGRGVANAIRVGVGAARGDYILLFAVDETGPTLAIRDMLALMERGCDLVSSTRYAHGGRRLGGSVVEGVLSRVGNRAFRFLSGSVLTDATTGIKMVRRSVFDQLTLDGNAAGWSVVFQLAIKAQAAGLVVGEVPIVSIDRLYGGKSTFSLGPWLREYFRWFLWGARELRRNPPQTRQALRHDSHDLPCERQNRHPLPTGKS